MLIVPLPIGAVLAVCLFAYDPLAGFLIIAAAMVLGAVAYHCRRGPRL